MGKERLESRAGRIPARREVLLVGLVHPAPILAPRQNAVLTLAVNAPGSQSCYELDVVTDKNMYSCQTDATGACSINHTTSQYSDSTNISVRVSRTCSITSTNSATYTVIGHL